MNNSYTYKTVHQLPGTFTAQLYSVLLAVKGGWDGVGGMHDWGDGCKIKVGFHKTEIHRRRPFHCFRAFHAALTEALGSISCFQRLVVHSLLYNEDTTVDRRGLKQGGCWILMMRSSFANPAKVNCKGLL